MTGTSPVMTVEGLSAGCGHAARSRFAKIMTPSVREPTTPQLRLLRVRTNIWAVMAVPGSSPGIVPVIHAAPQRELVQNVPAARRDKTGSGRAPAPSAPENLPHPILRPPPSAPICHPHRWCTDGKNDRQGSRASAKNGDSEKITINLGYVDLGQIDLLVQEGFYSNRTDFIRTAIRNQLDRHDDAVRQSVARTSARPGPAPLRPARPRGGARGRRDAAHPGARAGHHRTRTSRRNWPARPSPRSRCSAPCRPAPRSRPRCATAWS